MMKKLYISMMMLGAVAFTSCDMDLKPVGSLDEETAIQDEKDLRQFRNIINTNMRSVTAGAWVYLTDIQLDGFNGLISNGNNLSDFSFGQIFPSNSSVASCWAGCYAMIANANSLIEHADRMLASDSYTDDNKVMFTRYKGEAQFARAYAYFWLAEHFSQPYTQIDPNSEHSGIPLTTKYDPTGDISKYPDRPTLAETYKLIDDDLTAAYDEISAYEKSGVTDSYTTQYEKDSPTGYLSSYAVAAMQARVALVKGDWQTALDKAESVINAKSTRISLGGNTKYSLATLTNYKTMWSKDTGTEIIYQPIMLADEGRISTGSLYQTTDETAPQYIPNFGTLMMYDEGDVRFDAFFKAYDNGFLVEGSTYKAYAFCKYPGNSTLNPTKNDFVNMIKVFRISEMYLIAAEACGRLGDGANLTKGTKYLNDFCAKRYSGYTSKTWTSRELVDATLKERKLEFLGEGMRWTDLRRTGSGFTRESDFNIGDEAYDKINNVLFNNGKNIKYLPGDYRFTWPIPKDEIDANPKLASQQNPGY